MSKLEDAILESERNNDFEDLKLRNHRYASAVSTSFRKSFLGKMVESMAFGSALSDEEIQAAQDVAAISDIRKNIGDIDKVPDVYESTVKKAIKNLKVSSLLYQYYSYNSHDSAQNKVLFDMPIWTAGYSFGGSVGLAVGVLSSLNRAMSAEQNFYQLRKMNTEMTHEYLKMLNGFNNYAMNRNVFWMEGEAMRAATSVDPHLGANRIEYHNIISNFHDIYGKAVNIMTKYQAKFVEEQSKYNAEQNRYVSDIAFGMGLL